MREVGEGIWHWTALHPEFDRIVSSYAVDSILFDPLAVPGELRERATAVVLTCPWHRRDAPTLGLPIHVPPPDPPDPDPVQGEIFCAGDRLALGIQAYEGLEPNDLVLYVESRRAVIAGDTLVDFGDGLELNRFQLERQQLDREQIAARLRGLLDLAVDFVLPTHGEPLDGVALERALA